MAHIDTDGDIWITLKFPVGAHIKATKLYQIDTYPVPASKVTRHATRIEELPDYVAIRTGFKEEVEYAPMTSKQVQACSYTGSSGTDFFCPFGLSFFDISEETCLAALIKDNSTLIHKYCDFLFFRDHIKPGFIALSSSNFLLYDVDILLLTCGNNPTKSVIGCHFCVINVPCNCQVWFRNQRYFASVDEECSGVSGSVTRKHLVNLAMIKAFELNLHKDLAASESVDRPTMSAMPEINFYHHEFKDFVARDDKTGLSLKRIAQASKEHQKVFESLSDPLLMGKLNIPNTFEPVHIVFIVTAILIIGGVVVLIVRDRQNNSTIVELRNDIETLRNDNETLRNNVNRNQMTIESAKKYGYPKCYPSA